MLEGKSCPVSFDKRGCDEPNVKLECVPKFCYLGNTFSAGEGVEEVARARVRCAWGKFKELSLILTSRGASYHIKSAGRESAWFVA